MNSPYYKEGNYLGEVLEQGLTKASTGNKQFVLRVKILGTPLENDEYQEDKMQYTRSIYYTLTDKTIGFVAEALEVLGYDGDGIGPLDPAHPKHQSFKGQQVPLYCQHTENDKRETRESWRISSSTGSALKLTALSAKEIRELDALFGKSLKKKGATTSRPLNAPAAEINTQQHKDAVSVAKGRTDSRQAKPIPAEDDQYFAEDGTEITEEDIPF